MSNISQKLHWYQKDRFTHYNRLRKRFWKARAILKLENEVAGIDTINVSSARITDYLDDYYKHYFTWPWDKQKRAQRQENRWKLVQTLQDYEKCAITTVACSNKANMSTLSQISNTQYLAPWGVNINNLSPNVDYKTSTAMDKFYRYGFPLWRLSIYSLFALLLFTTIAAVCFLAITGGLGAPLAQLIAQAAQALSLGSALNGFLSLTPVVWLTAHWGLTFMIGALSAFFTTLVHREIAIPGFYARALNQYGHIIGYNVADWRSVMASVPFLHSLLTLAATPGKKGLRAYHHGKVKPGSENTLTHTLHNIAQTSPSLDDTGHLVKWLMNPIRWLQSMLTFTMLATCLIVEGRGKANATSHPLSSFLKFWIATVYCPLYLVLEPFKAFGDIPYRCLDYCLVTPLDNLGQQLLLKEKKPKIKKNQDSKGNTPTPKQTKQQGATSEPIILPVDFFTNHPTEQTTFDEHSTAKEKSNGASTKQAISPKIDNIIQCHNTLSPKENFATTHFFAPLPFSLSSNTGSCWQPPTLPEQIDLQENIAPIIS